MRADEALVGQEREYVVATRHEPMPTCETLRDDGRGRTSLTNGERRCSSQPDENASPVGIASSSWATILDGTRTLLSEHISDPKVGHRDEGTIDPVEANISVHVYGADGIRHA